MISTDPITLTEKQWGDIHLKLAREYADRPSVLIMRSVMRRELGFTVRRHTEYIEEQAHLDAPVWVWPKSLICLDFYDDAKKTLFVLKYL